MSESWWLIVLLVIAYVGECFGWTSKHTVLFRDSLGTRGAPSGEQRRNHWNWGLPGKWFESAMSGLHLRHLLPPLGSVFHCPVWPASLSPVAALAWVPFAMDREDRPDQSANLVHWQSGQSSKPPYARDKEVFLNDQPLMLCATEAHARHVIQLLHRLDTAPDPASREALIDAAWQSAFDATTLRQRLNEFAGATLALRILANLIFVWVFIALPTATYFIGLGRSWPWLLGTLAILMIATAVTFFRTHQRLQPKLGHERYKHTLIVLLSPPGAIRAIDALARDHLIGFHPLAVAQVVLTEERFLNFARRYVLDFRYAMPSQLQAAPPARDTLQWHMRREARHIGGFLNSLQLQVDELTLADPPADEACMTYCPRCQCQFVIPEGQCTLCDLPLVAFA